MKYQRYVVYQRKTKDLSEFRCFRTQVVQSGESWLPTGDPIEETARFAPADMLLDIGEYEENKDDVGPLSEITPPDGWAVAARLWLPDNYVPESQEVSEEHERRSIERLRKMGLWRDK